MGRVRSPDGTPIAFHKRGAGPPLVLVHGTGAANPTAWPAFPALEECFTLYALDRRGRGASGDGDAYALAREFEDVAAVVDSIGRPADLLGHSFGGLVALEAARLTRNVHKLVLYEPALTSATGRTLPEGVLARVEALIGGGDREGGWMLFMREVAMLPPDEIERFRASPAWPDRLAAAHTLPREVRAEQQYRFDPRRFQDLDTPTLLLAGGESPQFERATVKALDVALPNSRLSLMPGEQHLAMYTAPELFVHEVRTFLSAP